MKGRFRKGKKAFGKTLPLSGKQLRFKGRYYLFLEKKRIEALNAMRAMQAAIIMAGSATKTLAIRIAPGVTPAEKAIRIMKLTIDTAHSIQKIYQTA